jgi:hypothetical protein
MLSRVDGTHEWSIAPVELRHDEVLLPLRPVAGHTREYIRPHRNLVDGIITFEEHQRLGNIL